MNETRTQISYKTKQFGLKNTKIEQ